MSKGSPMASGVQSLAEEEKRPKLNDRLTRWKEAGFPLAFTFNPPCGCNYAYWRLRHDHRP
jgi:hypothetical protein